MTVSTQVKDVTANGNDVATTFSFSPMVLPESSADLTVTKVTAAGVETVLVEGTGATKYSVTVTEFPGTGSITYPEDEVTPLPTGESLIMKRVLVLEQQTDLENQGGYLPDTQEEALDRLVMIDLQQQEELDRTLKMPLAETTMTSFELPNTADGVAGDVVVLGTGKTSFDYATPNSSTYLTAPGSSTDNAIMRFDGITGRAFQNSGITISDADIFTHAAQTRWKKGADIASASPLVLGTDGNYFDVTGSTGFSAITCSAGTLFILQFDGAVALTNGASLTLPFAASQTTQAGDEMLCFATAANTVRAIAYKHATAAAARTALALGTADSPQFTGIELGHATDTTLARASAGVVSVEGSNLLGAAGNATLTGGFNATAFDAGTKSTGTFTPAPLSHNLQRAVNGGAHTLAVPATDCSMVIQYTNNASAGTITVSGYTEQTGEALTTTDGHDFLLFITRINGFITLHIRALQ